MVPTELEAVLLEHPDILDAAVIGVSDDFAGEVPKAFVVRRNDNIKETDVVNFIQGVFVLHLIIFTY